MNLSINALLLIRSLPLNSTCLWTLSLTGQHSSPTSLLYLWAASQYLPTFLIEFLSPSLFTRFESPSGISFRTSSGFIYSAWAPTGFSRTCFFSSSFYGIYQVGRSRMERSGRAKLKRKKRCFSVDNTTL